MPSVVPSKPSGATPMIVSFVPLTLICLLMTERIGAELGGPVGVAQHRDVAAADGEIVIDIEQTAERRLDTENRKVRARDVHALGVDGRLAGHRDVDAEAAMRGETGKRRVGLFEVAEHRIAQHLVAVAGLIARVRAGLRPGRSEIDEARRVGDRQRPAKHLIEEREDRRVRANAECERQHGDDRHEWRLEQRPERELEILHGRWTAGGIAGVRRFLRSDDGQRFEHDAMSLDASGAPRARPYRSTALQSPLA